MAGPAGNTGTTIKQLYTMIAANSPASLNYIKEIITQNPEIVKTLYSIPTKKEPIQQTLLMSAALRGNVGAMNILLENGAEINQENDLGQNALMFAILGKHLNAVEYLLTNTPVNRTKKNKNEKNALKYAVGIINKPTNISKGKSSSLELTTQLCSAENVNLQDNNGATALMYALAKNNFTVDKSFVNGELIPRTKIIKDGHIDVDLITLLLECGANPLIPTIHGDTFISSLKNIYNYRLGNSGDPNRPTIDYPTILDQIDKFIQTIARSSLDPKLKKQNIEKLSQMYKVMFGKYKKIKNLRSNEQDLHDQRIEDYDFKELEAEVAAEKAPNKLGAVPVAALNKLNVNVAPHAGGAKKRKPTRTHKGRKYVVRRGPRGGKYILVKQIKIYI